LGLAAMTATDNVFFIEANDVASVLPRFQPPWLPENQDLCSFDLKTCFATLFYPKTSIKHPINHENPIHGLKKPPQKPNSTRNQNST